MFNSVTHRGKSFKIDSKEAFLVCYVGVDVPLTAANTFCNLSSPASVQMLATGGLLEVGGNGRLGVLKLLLIG